MRRTGLVALLFLSSGAFAGSAELEQAKALAQQLKYEQAGQAVTKLLSDGSLTRDELCAALELGGVVAATLRQPAKAIELFTRLVSLAPDRQLPSGMPPRVMTPFYQARSAVESAGALAVVRDASAPVREGMVHPSFTVRGAAPHSLAKVRLHVAGEGAFELREVPFAPSVEVPAKSGFVRWWVELVDSSGRTLLVAASETTPFEDGTKPAPVLTPSTPDKTPPMVRAVPEVKAQGPNPWISAGVALSGATAIALGVGVGFGVSASSARHDFETAQVNSAGVTEGITRQSALVLSERAQSHGVAANIGFGVAGGLAVLAVGSFVIGAVVVTPAPGGVVVSGELP